MPFRYLVDSHAREIPVLQPGLYQLKPLEPCACDLLISEPGICLSEILTPTDGIQPYVKAQTGTHCAYPGHLFRMRADYSHWIFFKPHLSTGVEFSLQSLLLPSFCYPRLCSKDLHRLLVSGGYRALLYHLGSNLCSLHLHLDQDSIDLYYAEIDQKLALLGAN